MAESTQRSRTSGWWMVWLLCIQLLTILILMPGDWMLRVAEREHQMIIQTLGQDSATLVGGQSVRWYQRIFIDTGIRDAVYGSFFPTEAQRLRALGMQDLGDRTWFAWLEGRAVALKVTLLLMLERVAQIKLWLPFILITFLPAAWDGFMVWHMKYYNFAYASPWLHRLSIHTVGLLFFVLVVSVFFPVPIPPVILPLCTLCIAPIIGVAWLSNLPKRI